MSKCETCKTTKDVSWWSYMTDDLGGYYCGSCGSEPYNKLFKYFYLPLLILCVIGFIFR